MKLTDIKFDLKSFFLGAVFFLFIAYFFTGQTSQAQNGVHQIEATAEGVYILNVSSGKVRFRTREECKLYQGCYQYK